ncbi:MAG: hypothetical protein R6U27_05750 [Desulfobacterales bacterium]
MNESDQIKEKFRKLIIGFISEDDIIKPLKFLILSCPQKACLLIVGGALRNFIISQIYGKAPATKDIDMVIGGLGENYPLEKMLEKEKYKHTDFGGIRWYPKESCYSFDLSLLENFLPIAKFKLEPNVDNLLATIDFDVNALMFDIKNSLFYEKGALKAVREKTIGFNAAKTYHRGLLAYRLLLIRHKIGFYLSREAFRFIRTTVDLETVLWIQRTLKSKVDKQLRKAVLADYDRICMSKNYDEYKLNM